MKNSINHALTENQSKNKSFHRSQQNRYFQYLLTHNATNSMVCKVLGTDCKNGCRYKANLQKMNVLKITHLGICQHTKSSNVQYLTTNPELILKLIKNEND